MTEFLVTSGLVILIGGLFYVLVRQNNSQLKQVDTAINNEAAIRGLRINKIIYPGTREWTDSPFENEMKIGTSGFEGIPYNRQYYRIVKCQDQVSNSDKTMWVRATRSYRTKKLTLEWKEQS